MSNTDHPHRPPKMSNLLIALQYFWNWLDGNKTIFGALLLSILGQGFIPDDTFAYKFLFWIGGLLAGGGLLHKVAKGKFNTGAVAPKAGTNEKKQ